MTKTTVSSNLLQPLKVLTQLALKIVGKNLKPIYTYADAGKKSSKTNKQTNTCLHDNTCNCNFPYLWVLAILDILLPVEKPVWDFVLTRVLHNGYNSLHLPVQTKKIVVNTRWWWHVQWEMSFTLSINQSEREEMDKENNVQDSKQTC